MKRLYLFVVLMAWAFGVMAQDDVSFKVISKKRVRIKVLLSFLGHALFWVPIYYMNHLEAAIGVSVSTAWPYIALIAAVGLFVFQSCLYIDMYRRSKE